MNDKNKDLEQIMLFLLNQHISNQGLISQEQKDAIEREITKLSI